MATPKLPLTYAFAEELVQKHYHQEDAPTWVNYPVFLQSKIEHIVDRIYTNVLINEYKIGEKHFLFPLVSGYISDYLDLGASSYINALEREPGFSITLSQDIYDEIIKSNQY